MSRFQKVKYLKCFLKEFSNLKVHLFVEELFYLVIGYPKDYKIVNKYRIVKQQTLR